MAAMNRRLFLTALGSALIVVLGKISLAYGGKGEMITKIQKTEEEWKKILTPEQCARLAEAPEVALIRPVPAVYSSRRFVEQPVRKLAPSPLNRAELYIQRLDEQIDALLQHALSTPVQGRIREVRKTYRQGRRNWLVTTDANWDRELAAMFPIHGRGFSIEISYQGRTLYTAPTTT